MRKDSLKVGQVYQVKFPLQLRIHFLKIVALNDSFVRYCYKKNDNDEMPIFDFISNIEAGYFKLVS